MVESIYEERPFVFYVPRKPNAHLKIWLPGQLLTDGDMIIYTSLNSGYLLAGLHQHHKKKIITDD